MVGTQLMWVPFPFSCLRNLFQLTNSRLMCVTGQRSLDWWEDDEVLKSLISCLAFANNPMWSYKSPPLWAFFYICKTRGLDLVTYSSLLALTMIWVLRHPSHSLVGLPSAMTSWHPWSSCCSLYKPLLFSCLSLPLDWELLEGTPCSLSDL